jgi:hypothetical protein
LHFHLINLYNAVDDGVDGESAHGMDVQFARDVFAVREDRVDGKEKFGCNFLVGQSFDDVGNDFPFPFGEGIGFVGVARRVGLVGDALFEQLHCGEEQGFLHFAVCTQVGFAVVDAEEHVAKHVARSSFGGSVVFDDDVFEFLQLLVHAVMAFGVLLYAKLGDVFSGDEPIDVTEDLSILVFHVLAHLVHVFVEELQDEKRHLVLSRAVDGFEEFAPDVQELEVEEKVVGGT